MYIYIYILNANPSQALLSARVARASDGAEAPWSCADHYYHYYYTTTTTTTIIIITIIIAVIIIYCYV